MSTVPPPPPPARPPRTSSQPPPPPPPRPTRPGKEVLLESSSEEEDDDIHDGQASSIDGDDIVGPCFEGQQNLYWSDSSEDDNRLTGLRRDSESDNEKHEHSDDEDSDSDDEDSERGDDKGDDAFVGRRVRKKFGRRFFLGTVKSFDKEHELYLVEYDDGDAEDLWRDELLEVLYEEPDEAECSKKAARRAKKKIPKKTAAKKRAAAKHDASWTGKPEDVKETPFSGPPAGPTKRGRVRQNAFDKEPTPMECFEEFYTPEMMMKTYDNSWAYVTHIGVIKRPTYVPARRQWPPKWRAKFLKDHPSLADLKHWMGHLVGLAAPRQAGGGGGPTKWFSAGWNVAKRWLQAVTSRSRFVMWRRALHCDHPLDDEPGKMRKIGKLLEMFRQRCLRAYKPSRDLSWDEATAQYEGRKCSMKHRQRRYKPHDGLRIYSLAEASTGYIYDFVPDLRDGTTVEEMTMRGFDNIAGQGYNVYADNLFISVSSCRRAKEMGVNIAGTTRANFGFDKALFDSPGVKNPGDYAASVSPDGIACTVWVDSTRCRFMTNFVAVNEHSTVPRRRAGQEQREDIVAPLIAVLYNNQMGGVDRADALRASMTTRMKSCKWWHAVFSWILDTALINAYIYYKACKPAKVMSREDFYRAIAEGLMETVPPTATGGDDAISILRSKWKETPQGRGVIRLQECGDLYPDRWDQRGECRLCAAVLRLHKQVYTGCRTCDTFLCVECMRPWHDLTVGKRARRT